VSQPRREVEPAAFEQVRENPLQFLVAGHEDPDVESVVER
jgi:hypothetical protein